MGFLMGVGSLISSAVQITAGVVKLAIGATKALFKVAKKTVKSANSLRKKVARVIKKTGNSIRGDFERDMPQAKERLGTSHEFTPPSEPVVKPTLTKPKTTEVQPNTVKTPVFDPNQTVSESHLFTEKSEKPLVSEDTEVKKPAGTRTKRIGNKVQSKSKQALVAVLKNKLK